MNYRYLLVAGLLSTLVASCRPTEAEQTPVEYSVMKVATADVTLDDTYPATVRGRQDIEIYPQVEGTIHQVCIKEGQSVRRGERLFVIDQVPYQAALRTVVANVRTAQAQVETAELDYRSKQVLFDEKVISEYTLSTSRNALAVAQAALEQAKAQETNARNSLSYTEVTSPADGVVGTLPYRVGALVSPSLPQPLTTVSDNSQMYVYFSMGEKELQSLVRRYGSIDKTLEGMPDVQLRLADGTTYPQTGRIASISGVLNLETGSGSLRAEFPNEDRLLFSGGTGNVVVPYTLKEVISIPQDATYELQDKIFVYRVVEGKAVATRITVHPIHDGKTYTVTSGLQPGEVIVTTGVGLLNDGDEVNVKP